jgi:hypothetical protein
VPCVTSADRIRRGHGPTRETGPWHDATRRDASLWRAPNATSCATSFMWSSQEPKRPTYDTIDTHVMRDTRTRTQVFDLISAHANANEGAVPIDFWSMAAQKYMGAGVLYTRLVAKYIPSRQYIPWLGRHWKANKLTVAALTRAPSKIILAGYRKTERCIVPRQTAARSRRFPHRGPWVGVGGSLNRAKAKFDTTL